MAVFCSARFACLGCHQIGKEGGAVGPALTDVGRRLKAEEIAESLLWPKRQIKPEFSAWQILLNDGRSLQGYKRSETSETLQLFDLARQQSISLAKADIEEQHECRHADARRLGRCDDCQRSVAIWCGFCMNWDIRPGWKTRFTRRVR